MKKEFETALMTLQKFEDDLGCPTAHGLLSKLKHVACLGTIYILSEDPASFDRPVQSFFKGVRLVSRWLLLILIMSSHHWDKNLEKKLGETASRLGMYLIQFCDKLIISSKEIKELEKLQDDYPEALLQNIEKWFKESSPVISALKIFDPLAVPPPTDSHFSFYGNNHILVLSDHFFKQEEDREVQQQKLQAESQHFKFMVNSVGKEEIPENLEITLTEWFLAFLIKRKNPYLPLSQSCCTLQNFLQLFLSAMLGQNVVTVHWKSSRPPQLSEEWHSEGQWTRNNKSWLHVNQTSEAERLL